MRIHIPAKIDMDNGSYPIAKDIGRVLAKTTFTNIHRGIIDAVLDQTYGYHDPESRKEQKIKQRKVWAEISLDFLTAFTCASRARVSQRVNELVAAGVLLRKVAGKKRSYAFNQHVDQWDVSVFKSSAMEVSFNGCQDRQPKPDGRLPILATTKNVDKPTQLSLPSENNGETENHPENTDSCQDRQPKRLDDCQGRQPLHLYSSIKKRNIFFLIKSVIGYLNVRTGSDFNPENEETRQLVMNWVVKGVQAEDFNRVIDLKAARWLDDEKMTGYLRPKTLFGPDFEGYLQEANRKLKIKTSDAPRFEPVQMPSAEEIQKAAELMRKHRLKKEKRRLGALLKDVSM